MKKGELLCFSFIIVISIGPFSSSPIINKVHLGPFSCIYFSFAYHTSHSESLDVTERIDVPVSTRSVILDTLVVGLAAVDGDSAELRGVQPDSERDLMPFCPIA